MLSRGTFALGGIALVLALAVGLAAGSSDDFKPKNLKGEWAGTWQNLGSGAEGAIAATVKVRREKLIATVDFGGDPFGCGDPPAGKAALEHGTGKNTWNASGFKVDEPTAGFGDLIFIYQAARKKITATGDSPCQPSTTFRLHGKLKDSTLSATVDVTAGDGTRASGKLSADKG